MRSLLLALLVVFVAWRAYVAYGPGRSVRIEGGPGQVRIDAGDVPVPPPRSSPPAAPSPAAARKASLAGTPPAGCDGHTRCTQMRSCAEATWFLEHCPGVELDGDGDGVPCEQQWCGR